MEQDMGVLGRSGCRDRIIQPLSACVDHMAFQMVTVLGADQAFAVFSDTYRAFHVFRFTNGAVMLGWPVLAIGA